LTAPLYAAYARHSDRHQAGSVEQQIEVFQSYAAAHGHTVPEAFTFSDRGKSGTTDVGRDGLLALMALLERRPRPVKGVYVYDSSRLGRNEEDTAFYRASIRKLGYDLVYVGDQSLNDSGDLKHILEAVKGHQDAEYSKKLGRDVRRGMLSTLAKGGVAGKPPKGYRNERIDTGNGRSLSRLVPDPAIWDTCRRAWTLRAAGASLVDIHRETRLFSAHAAYNLFFKNPIYRGTQRYDGQEFPDFCTPIVTPAEWAAVQRVGETHYHPRSVSSPYLLTGLVVCPHCQGRMVGKNSRKRDRIWRYYVCNTATIYKLHEARGIPVGPLEQAVIEDLARVKFDPAVLGPLVEQALAERRDRQGRHHGAESSLRRQLAACEAAIANLMTVVEQGGFASVSARLAERESERATLQSRLLDARERVSLDAVPDVDVPAMCAQARAVLETGTTSEKKRLIRSCVEAVYPNAPKLHIDFRAPIG